MMKRFFIGCGILALCCFLYSFGSHPNPPSKKSGKLAGIKTVIIDPGHGGRFSGASGLISTEKNVTLEISLKLGAALQKEFPDLKVLYTRTTDACSGNATSLKEDLSNRAKIANESRGDLFISIHCNATQQPAGSYYLKRVIGHRRKTIMVGRGKRKRRKTISEPIYESYLVKNTRIGTETYIWKAEKKSDKLSAINRNDETTGEVLEDSTAEQSAFDISSPEARIRTQLYEKKFFQNSAFLASLVEEEFKSSGRTSYGVKQRDVGIQVLQATGMPSVLIETGFLTNKEEEEYLNSDKGQDEIVDDVVAAFKRYKQSIESKGASGNHAPAEKNK
jgi:N-acetylmuramoyl-L-alanine amidase